MFLKLANVKEFTVQAYGGYQWKLWDEVAKTMLVSSEFKAGYKQRYLLTVTTEKNGDHHQLEVSQEQLNQMLGKALDPAGNSSLVGKTFDVKTNGETGKDIRYYFNGGYVQGQTEAERVAAAFGGKVEASAAKMDDTQDIDVNQIPF